MMAALQMIVAFILALGTLITFHELGHFLVARRFDVKILKFSVGFGRALWSRKFGHDNTEFVIGAIPLGGYVKMLDEREGSVTAAERARAFNNKTLGARVAIVAAGPIFNFIFAALAYWIIYMVGITGLKPVIGSVQEDSMAARAGFQAHDEILEINGRATPTWNSAMELLIAGVVDRSTATVRVKDTQGHARLEDVELAQIPIDAMAGSSLLSLLGIEPARPVAAPIIGALTYQGRAWQAGLEQGDRIITVDGIPVQDWQGWVELVRAAPETPLVVSLSRAGQIVELIITPEARVTEQGDKIGFIGASLEPDYDMDQYLFATESYPLHSALAKGIGKTIDMTVITLQILGRMITGQASLKNLSGPVSIAQFAGQTAQMGLVAFLGFLAIVSISLAVLNLLPVPLLDGGHLFYYCIEFVKGSPVSASTELLGQRIGLVLLFSLMAVAIFNDISRLAG